jgi:SAM-dependent methyltransferase
MNIDLQQHWQKVYETKQPEEVSWTQTKPGTSLQMIRDTQLPKSARIIDIGGGDSRLADFLLEEGYTDITVLDISQAAADRANKRLGNDAGKVKRIVTNILDFAPTTQYDIWHDRATFHFLTSSESVQKYVSSANKSISDKGYLLLGTFSLKGPLKCSGLPVQQYSAETLQTVFQPYFQLEDYRYESHVTPFNTEQNFLFARLKKK